MDFTRFLVPIYWAAGSGAQKSPASEQVEEVVKGAVDFAQLALAIAVGVVIGIALSIAISAIFKLIGHKKPWIPALWQPAKHPIRLFLVVLSSWISLSLIVGNSLEKTSPSWYEGAKHGGLILSIVSITWLVAGLLRGLEKSILQRVRFLSSSRAKRVETQLQIVTRVTVAAIWVLGVSVVLLTFPAARAVGTSLLASAGLASVVAGLAAQSTLGNIFAGLQLAFSDAVRVDDLVKLDGQISTIEEITLTYVVAKVWDGRRIIVPTTNFTTKPFENWTRRTPELIGSVDLELDWRVPIPQMRSELEHILGQCTNWDGRTGVLIVSDASNGRVKVTAMVSAASSPQLTDLKNFVREKLVRWVQAEAPYAIPHHLMEASTRLSAEQKIDPAQVLNVTGNAENSAQTDDEKIASTRKNAASSAKTLDKVQTKAEKSATLKTPIAANPAGEKMAEKAAVKTPDKSAVQLPAGGAGVPRVPVKTLMEQANAHPEFGADETGYEASLFSGTPENERRAAEFAGPSKQVLAERDSHCAHPERKWNPLEVDELESNQTGSDAGQNADIL